MVNAHAMRINLVSPTNSENVLVLAGFSTRALRYMLRGRYRFSF